MDELFLLNDKILINTARGSIINNFELKEYILAMGRIYLGLDVFEEEPLSKDSIFRKDTKRIIISAHNTNTSPKFCKNVHMNSIKMLKENIDE